jgi:hypothetical protein
LWKNKFGLCELCGFCGRKDALCGLCGLCGRINLGFVGEKIKIQDADLQSNLKKIQNNFI